MAKLEQKVKLLESKYVVDMGQAKQQFGQERAGYEKELGTK